LIALAHRKDGDENLRVGDIRNDCPDEIIDMYSEC
jgi:hypothetical protein